jgi:hypothetical protein
MLQWADTFNRYGTNTALLLDGAYAENIHLGFSTLVADPDPMSTVKVLKVLAHISEGYGGLRYVLSSSQTTVGMASKWWMSSIPAALTDPTPTFEFRTVTNTKICDIRCNPVGGIAAYNSAGTKIGETVSPVLVANAWNHVECKVFRSATVGTLEVRVNGSLAALNLTGLNLGANDIAQVLIGDQYGGTSAGLNVYHKDFIVWDGTGSYNNNFMGTCAVLDIDADSDVSLTWTPSTGANGWSILDNNPPLDDSAYISAATAVLANTFTLKDLPADVTSVRGGVVVHRSRKIDGGDGNIQTSLISGATTGSYADRPITVAYTYWKDVFETDPNTGAPFTPANFNAAKLKLSRTV